MSPSPEARVELDGDTGRRIFTRREDRGLAIGVACGLAFVLLTWVLWYVVRHG